MINALAAFLLAFTLVVGICNQKSMTAEIFVPFGIIVGVISAIIAFIIWG